MHWCLVFGFTFFCVAFMKNRGTHTKPYNSHTSVAQKRQALIAPMEAYCSRVETERV